MPVIFDYKCTKCGHSKKDHMLRNANEEAPDCSLCGEKMEKLFTGFSTPQGTKHHNRLPSEYKLSKGGASFGRMQDL